MCVYFTPMYDTCAWHSFSIYNEPQIIFFHFAIIFCQYFSSNKMKIRSELEKDQGDMPKYLATTQVYPRANGAKRRSGRKPGARGTISARLLHPGKSEHSEV